MPIHDTRLQDRTFLARYGAAILRGGIAAIPAALYRYQAELGLGPQLVWFISAILAHKWDADLPHPSLVRMAEQTGVSRQQLHNYERQLVQGGWLTVINRQTAQGGKATNLYDFATLFGRLEDLLRRDSGDSDSGQAIAPLQGYVNPGLHRDVNNTAHRDVNAGSHLKESVYEERNHVEPGETEISKFRRVHTRGKQADERTPAPAHAATEAVETMLSFTHKDHREQIDPVPPTSARGNLTGFQPISQALPDKPRRRSETVYDENREVLLAYITDFARELNDRASLTASTTRAVHLLQRSGLPREAFIQRLYEARALTKERSASIRATTRDPKFPLPVKAKMPFFFACLERLLGLREDEPMGEDAARRDIGRQEPPISSTSPSHGAQQRGQPAQSSPPLPAKNPYTTGKYGRLVQE